MPTPAFAVSDPTSPLRPTELDRREPGSRDVAIDILFCGVCHSDYHFARGEWFPIEYPLTPGHEIIGRVTAMGAEVTGFSIGQLVGVGCLVDSCRTCPSCADDLENYCTGGFTMTYGSPDPISGGLTAGGYSTAIVVDQDFVLTVPDGLEVSSS